MDDKTVAFIEWLNEQVNEVGSIRELARRTGTSHTSIAQVLSREREPTFDFVAIMAQWANSPLERMLQMAGLLPERYTREEIEREILHYFDQLPPDDQARLIVIARAWALEGKEKRRRQRNNPGTQAGAAATLD